MTEDMPTYRRWRADLEKHMRRGEMLEAIAAQHPEIPFTVEVYWSSLEWHEFSEDIHAFSARVRKIAAIFGRPTTVTTTGGSGEEAPDMKATWKLADARITVNIRSYSPECRVHPESKYVPSSHVDAQYPAIHPECADVLKELEDYEPELASLAGDNR
jgi:hypothetical protein